MSAGEKAKIKNVALIILLIAIMCGACFLIYHKTLKTKKPKEKKEIKDVELINDYNLDLIHLINENSDGNYLISPYSIEIALNMLKSGASGETYNQIDKVVSQRTIPFFESKKRISVANAMFIRNKYKNEISNSFINSLKNNYDSEVIYDDFTTPDKINSWVKDKTYKMIPSILDEMSDEFVLGLANAVAIDVDWLNQFECVNTKSETFQTNKGLKKVEMMSNTYPTGNKYLKTDDEIGIIIPYNSYTKSGEVDYYGSSDSISLEFVALMPKGNVNEYVKSLNNEKFNNVLNSFTEVGVGQELSLKLPRFEYDYSIDNFIGVLQSLGIVDAFGMSADFSRMVKDKNKLDLYVGEAVHKSHISLNEKGTKAAAVTYFGMFEKSAFEQNEIISLTFNKPFLYMIRDSKTKELLFFGVVQSPNEWKGSTCSNS